jgi:hypothetical protein
LGPTAGKVISAWARGHVSDSAVKTACRHGSAQDHCPSSLDRNCATDEKWFPTPKAGRPTVTNARAGKRTGRYNKNSQGKHADRNPNTGQDKEPRCSACYVYAAADRQGRRSGMMFWWAIGEPICLGISTPGHVRRMQQNSKLGAIKVQQGAANQLPIATRRAATSTFTRRYSSTQHCRCRQVPPARH